MAEYDQLCSILSDEFLASSQDVMVEVKEDTHKAQRVNIYDGKRGLIRNLYRFDLEEKEFLHFFDKTNNSPEGLRKFCDYVLLVKHDDKTFVLLIELKRGDTSGADKQLKASEVFIEFLHKTAERLHRDYGDFDFNRRNVVLRKIIIKEVKSNKTVTKGTRIDKNQDIITYKSAGQFPLAKFL